VSHVLHIGASACAIIGGLLLAEAQRMWFKSADRYWDRKAMQQQLTDLALASGMTDRIAILVATAPEDLARWNNIVSQRAAPQ